MIIMIKLIGAAVAVIGFLAFLNPGIMKNMIAYRIQGKRVYLGGVINAVLGTIFLASAMEARFSWVIYWSGVLMLMKALLIFAMGLQRAKAMLGWWEKRPGTFLRLYGLLVSAIGILILWAA